jgi:hypothetical protein
MRAGWSVSLEATLFLPMDWPTSPQPAARGSREFRHARFPATGHPKCLLAAPAACERQTASLRPHEPARGRKLIVHRILSLLRTWITGNQPCELGRRLRRANMRGPRSCRALWRAGPAARYGARISEGPFGSSWLSPGQAKRPCGTGWGHRLPSTCSELANCREVLE